VSPAGILVLALIIGIPLLVMLEAWRQRRKLQAMGETVKPYRGSDLAGAGLLRLQGLLQPDRKVEIVLKEERDHHDEAEPGGAKPPAP
jgi:hypothetical protein